MKPRILFLTNQQNGAAEEDEMLVNFLSQDFDLVVSHPLDCLPHLDSVQGVIIRNVWPTHEYQEDWEDVKNYIRNSDLLAYNPLRFKGDIEGKDYLVVLYNKGFPVIPSVDGLRDLGKLPRSEYYWIKPKKSCDGIGAEKLSKDALERRNPKGYIIQPFVEFEYEPSFFFIDNQFHHALCEKHRLLNDLTIRYDPTRADLDFAMEFVRWSSLEYGIQRIDAVRTKDGRLLLTEIENLCPYLYLAELQGEETQEFLDAIRTSMLKVFRGFPALEEAEMAMDAVVDVERE